MCGRRGSGRARHERRSSGTLLAPLGVALDRRPAHPGPRYSPATLARPPRRGRHDAGAPDPGGGDRGDRGAAEMRARRRRRCSSRPPRRSAGQWELSRCLRGRPRGRGRGSAWETGLRLARLTIAPPPPGQSAAADTGAGRSDWGWGLTTGARWVPGSSRPPRAAGRMRVGGPGVPSRADPGARPGGRGEAGRRGGRGAATEPLTKRAWAGRAASASSRDRPAKLPVTFPRWGWPMAHGAGARVGARAARPREGGGR